MLESNHCQICEREIKAKNGIIAHHGYTRPYPQEQTSSCNGAKELPYEESRDALPREINWVKLRLNSQEARLVGLMEEPPETLTYFSMYSRAYDKTYNRPDGFDPIKNIEEGMTYGEYENEHRSQVRKVKQDIGWTKHELSRLQKRYDNWVKVR